MIKYNKETIEIDVVDKIICNVCGEEIKKDFHGEFEDFLHIEKKWGYNSQNDGLNENIDVCELCWIKIKDSFKVK